MSDIRSFILLTGQELVAELVHDTSEGFFIKKPLVVHVMNSPTGPSLAFAPWSLVQDQDAGQQLYRHALAAAPVELIKEVSDSYLQQTTGIILAPSSGGQILHG